MASPIVGRSFQSDRTLNFTESVIREMTRLAIRHGAVNLAQGFPDFAAPVDLKEAAIRAIEADHNQYTITWGAKVFRDAIAAKYLRSYGLEVDPEREVTVTCGATEGMAASLLATTNPGDEVIVFEPFYESYHPDTLLCGAARKLVKLYAPDWRFDADELRKAFSPRTKAIIVNTPHNPTGKVFTRAELTLIASLCQEFDTIAITDEIYEHIVYDRLEHIPLITLPGMRERTILVNSLSKTFSVTGWRVGWAIAAPELTTTVRKVHDFLTVNAATPLQYAGAMALNEQQNYFNNLSDVYGGRRQAALDMLTKAGFRCYVPGGAYYIMTDISAFDRGDDISFARHLVEHLGVAGVPGSSFYFDRMSGSSQMRFCFCKNYETLSLAGLKLAGLRNS
ncbi:MAG TPA: aminotransferase class I/II-fold pyridoxal phosphate-dependent enzyme [Bryobacteraceae bacterium]|nr:aminotransferase class I/II-fold pyridoxal phosphate-dependent enzyme [Bryobacteraceae bacterium]